LRWLELSGGCRQHTPPEKDEKGLLSYQRNKITPMTTSPAAAQRRQRTSSFSRYFAMKNNKPFSRFIAEIRIKHACKMLTETDESIAQICYDCGFNTLSNFNRQFKELMLKKPMQYKKEFMSI